VRTIDLAAKDLVQLLRDWRTALFLFAMPVVFTFIFGFAFGGFGGEGDSRLPVGLLDKDGAGGAGWHLAALLGESDLVGVVAIETSQERGLDKKVRDGDLAAAVIVPVGYGEALLAGKTMPVTVISKKPF